jgi:capsular polysaccharide biosynthesis protein
VEASEAGRRIFWRHRWLLLVLMILPAAGVVALKERQPVTYTATATIQGQDTTPDATTQVSAIQSRVAAVASAPTLVQAAISQAKISRNATQVAKHDISVSPLSSSAIMAITVTDKSPQAALALSGTLATAVVNQLNELGVKDNPLLAQLSKTNAELQARRDHLLIELNTAGTSDAATSVPVQSLLSQLGAAEQELADNQSSQQQVLATLTTETGASVVSVPTTAVGASRHIVVYGVLAGLLGLVVGLLLATLREVLRPTVAQPGAGARELGAVLFGSAEERRGQIVALGQDLPERLNLAAHRAGVRTLVLTGPGSPGRLSSLAARLRGELPSPEPADARALGAARIETNPGGNASPNGDVLRRANAGSEHRTVGLATADRSAGVTAAVSPMSQRTVVALNEIRLGAPPPDAALVVVLPRFAPHSALDQAADLGVTADWPILGVIGIRRRSWLARLNDRYAGLSSASTRDAAAGDATQTRDTEAPDTVLHEASPRDIHHGGDDD